jgi:hypothetical protein
MNANAESAHGGLIFLLLTVVVLLLGLFLKGALAGDIPSDITNPLPPLNDHALLHGWKSVCVYEWCKRLENPDHYKWDCGDGKLKWVFPMEQGEWGFYVATEGLFRTITSFPVYDANYLRSVLKGCSNKFMSVEDLL